MAKIPENTLKQIKDLLLQAEVKSEEIKQLTYHVNEDVVDWNGIDIIISDDVRNEMVAKYGVLKTEIKDLINQLP